MRKARLAAVLKRSIAFPRHRVLRRKPGGARWVVYFVYAPEDRATAQHLWTIGRLRREPGLRLLIVAASPNADWLAAAFAAADTLIWKATPGFDFSAYAVGLWWLARHASGCDVFVMNDSVYGPFRPLAPFLARAQWRITGLTGSSIFEDHVQSYAFVVRRLDFGLLLRMLSIFNLVRAFETFEDVVLCQELRFARVARRSVDVGAFWYAGDWPRDDATLDWPFELLDQGFPFIKKALLGKNVDRQPPGLVAARLAALGHPS